MKLVIAFETFIGTSFLFWVKKFDNKTWNLLNVYHIIYILQSLYCAALVMVLASYVHLGYHRVCLFLGILNMYHQFSLHGSTGATTRIYRLSLPADHRMQKGPSVECIWWMLRRQ